MEWGTPKVVRYLFVLAETKGGDVSDPRRKNEYSRRHKDNFARLTNVDCHHHRFRVGFEAGKKISYTKNVLRVLFLFKHAS